MKPLICVYCEGNDTKFGVFVKEKNQIKMLKAASIDVYGGGGKKESVQDPLQLVDGDAGLQLEGDMSANLGGTEIDSGGGSVFEGVINSELQGIKLNQSLFIPVLTEPSVYYQLVSKKTTGGGGNTASVTQEIFSENSELKEKKVDRDTYAKVELADGGTLTVYVRQDIACIRMINRLAQYNNRRFYKIVSVKSAEISLVNYVAKKKKFFPDDFSLIVYIGKEYSKLIFLQGRKLRHIGSTLDIGTSNLHTYDVYFSKILLEMENGGIPTLDNIVVCGEDVSENLILSFYGTFPETNVSRVEFEEIDVTSLSDENRASISSFTMPIAVATEYFEEQAKQYTGINLLPKYVKEDQKILQFAWHGYLMFPLLFGAAFYITMQILANQSTIRQLNTDIAIQTQLKQQNLAILSQIEELQARISNFDQTQTILDSVSVGTEVWGNFLKKSADYAATKRNYWFRGLSIEEITGVKVEGHSLDKKILTDVTSKIDSAILKSVNFDPIKVTSAYRFVINFKVLK